MPANRNIRAVEAGLWTDGPDGAAELAASFYAERTAFEERMNLAWEAGDGETFLRMATIRRQAAPMNTKLALRLTAVLIEAGWPDEALELLTDRRHWPDHGSRYWFFLAQAKAGLGAIDEALAAARTGLEMAPGLEGMEELSAQLEEMAALEARIGKPMTWDEAMRLLRGYLAFGLVRRAADAVRTLIGGSLVPDAEQLEELLRTCCGFLRRLEPGHILQLLRRLAAPLPKPARRPLDLAMGILTGGPAARLARPGRQEPVRAQAWRASALALARSGRLESAIVELGDLTLDRPRDEDIRRDLARCIGERVLQDHRPSFEPPSGRRKIIDVFPFNGEFDILTVKLEEMSDWVDRFVLVESPLTFTGSPKPLYFAEAKDRFARYANKLIHVVADVFPDYIGCAWSREFFQRDSGLEALSGLCARDDLVLITDVDEILDRQAIEPFFGGFAGLRLRTSRYFYNYRRIAGPGVEPSKSVALPARSLQHFGLSFARVGLGRIRSTRINDAGWHFTSVGDADRIANKLKSYSHQENLADLEPLLQRIDRIAEGLVEPGWERCGLDSLPRYVRDHPAQFADRIL